MCTTLTWWCGIQMVKHRIDVYLSTQSLMYVDKLKEKWGRKNYSQTIDHMIANYVKLLERSIKTKKMRLTEEENELSGMDKINKKYGIGDKYANDR